MLSENWKKKEINISRVDFVKRNFIWSGISNIFYTFFPFFIRTFFVQNLGSEYLGLNSLCTSLLYVLNAADFGVTGAFVYRLYYPVAKKDINEVCKLLNFYRKIYRFIGVIILLVGIVILPFFDILIKEDRPDNINIFFVFAIYLINTVLSYVIFAYQELVLIANQHRDYVDMVGCFALGLMYCIQIYFIMRGSYYGYLITMPVITLLSNVVKNIVVKKKYPYYICKGNISKEYETVFFKDIISMAIYKYRDMSRSIFDNIIISAFIGLLPLAYYQNYYTVLVVPLVLRNILVTAIAPSMGNCIAEEDKQVAYEVYKIFVFVYTHVSGWFSVCYGYLIQDFVVLWLGERYLLSGEIVLLLVIYYYVLGFCDQTKMLREAAGLWRKGRLLACIEMIANLFLNIFLVYLWGMIGIVAATILTIIFINIPFENFIVFHDFFKCNCKDIIVIYIRSFVWLVVAGAVTGIFCNFVVCEGYKQIVLKIIICVVVPAIIFFIQNYKKEELRYILRQFNLRW